MCALMSVCVFACVCVCVFVCRNVDLEASLSPRGFRPLTTRKRGTTITGVVFKVRTPKDTHRHTHAHTHTHSYQ